MHLMRTIAPALIVPVSLALVATVASAQSPFASEVVEFRPAPGQFVQNPLLNDPAAALGAPSPGPTGGPDNNSIVSLGGFGGTLVLRFAQPVFDDPANPFGIDAIVFGNAFFVAGNPNARWAECATIEIARDQNNNGLADDPWYVIRGSHLPAPPAAALLTVMWDDNLTDPTYPPMDGAWIPPGEMGVWSTSGFELPPTIFGQLVLENPLGPDSLLEGIWGYADHTPAAPLGDTDGDGVVDDTDADPATFFTRPDDPLRVGISPGSAGGDGFDIRWAVDPDTGAPANLTSFDFLRLRTASDALFINPFLGEVSTEIDAAADVSTGALGDVDGDLLTNSRDRTYFLDCYTGPIEPLAPVPCTPLDFDASDTIDLFDFAEFQVLYAE